MEELADYSRVEDNLDWDESLEQLVAINDCVVAEAENLEDPGSRTVVINTDWSYSRYREWIDTLAFDYARLTHRKPDNPDILWLPEHEDS